MHLNNDDWLLSRKHGCLRMLYSKWLGLFVGLAVMGMVTSAETQEDGKALLSKEETIPITAKSTIFRRTAR